MSSFFPEIYQQTVVISVISLSLSLKTKAVWQDDLSVSGEGVSPCSQEKRDGKESLKRDFRQTSCHNCFRLQCPQESAGWQTNPVCCIKILNFFSSPSIPIMGNSHIWCRCDKSESSRVIVNRQQGGLKQTRQEGACLVSHSADLFLYDYYGVSACQTTNSC